MTPQQEDSEDGGEPRKAWEVLKRPRVPCNHLTVAGEPCRNYAIRGGTVCRSHGGAVKGAKRKAAQRVAEAKIQHEAMKLLAKLEVAPMDDPEKALRESAGALHAMAVTVGEALIKANALTDTRSISEHTRVLDRLQSLLRDMNNANSILMQHGRGGTTVGGDDEDGRTGREKLDALLDDLAARRDANMLPCPSCKGDGFVPRWTADQVAGEVTAVVVEGP